VPALAALGRLLDLLAALDDVVLPEPEVEGLEVDPFLAQPEQLGAAAAGGERRSAEQPELLVLGRIIGSALR
jgi:hypothetical protein